MAKRAGAAQDGVNVTREVLAIVEGNQGLRGSEVLAQLKERFPNATFNNNSVQVAFANARRKLGLTRVLARRPRKKTLLSRRPKPAAALPVTVVTTDASPGIAAVAVLQSARDLLKAADGNVATARQALELVASLQMG